ncbi:MAG TPA: UDP-N-acetylglucosamine 2-epimerase (non-hydrolyzing), partial [Longimicrobium sp.]|nr:UDP-N-acetylglucosamine 2-epimerase (non-hydrolyzing) [Longimicrobium sp.]
MAETFVAGTADAAPPAEGDALKVLSVVGARPQFIKAATVSRALTARPGVREVMVHTGQHFDVNMSDVFFGELEIPEPAYNLGIRAAGHGAMTGRMLEAIEQVMLDERPDVLLAYGDTNSTLAAALAAAKLHLPVVHVESGLRSYNRIIPEEVNRVLTDHASDLLLAPTQTAVDNLMREGFPPERVALVGDVTYDAALYYGEAAERRSTILQRLGVESKGYAIATVHRAENTGCERSLRAIFGAFAALAAELPVVLPLHPRTRGALAAAGVRTEGVPGLHLVEPVGYLDMAMLTKHARLVATDSGGVQKEAFFYRVPCVTLRPETEWTELVELGWNVLAPPTDAETLETVLRRSVGRTGREGQPYGDGRSSERVAELLLA